MIRFGKVLDPGDHLRRREAGTIDLNRYESENSWYSGCPERMMAGTFEIEGSGEREPVGRPSTTVG